MPIPPIDPALFQPRMPEVDTPPNLEEIFAKARKVGTGELSPTNSKGRHTAVVTPGRMVMMHPCPEPGTMSPTAVESVEKLLPSTTKRQIAVIAYTDLRAMRADLMKTIPFYGMLTGMAYIGHSVWIFEGHPSALRVGCRDADILIVDEEMIPFLQADWIETATAVMRTPLIYKHHRRTFSLLKVFPPLTPVADP